jgi:hypothetical protein
LVVLVVAAILFDEAALVISIVLAFLVVAILIRAWRIVRRGRWWSRALLGIAILAALCAGLVSLGVFSGPNSPEARPGASIQFRASGAVDNQTITVHEEVFYDSAFLKNISAAISRPDQQITASEVTIQGWTLERTLNGYPIYSDTEYGDVSSSSPIRDHVTMPISLGDATVTLPGHVYTVGLVAAEGSELRLTAPRSTVSAISPPASERADLPDSQELIVVPLTPSDEAVSADVLKPFMRHPIGVKINEVFASGILPAVEWFALTAMLAALRNRLAAYAKHVLTGWLRRRTKRDRGGPAQATTGDYHERMAGAAETARTDADHK